MQQDTTAQAPKNTHSSPRALDAQGRALQREGEGDRRGLGSLKTVRRHIFYMRECLSTNATCHGMQQSVCPLPRNTAEGGGRGGRVAGTSPRREGACVGCGGRGVRMHPCTQTFVPKPHNAVVLAAAKPCSRDAQHPIHVHCLLNMVAFRREATVLLPHHDPIAVSHGPRPRTQCSFGSLPQIATRRHAKATRFALVLAGKCSQKATPRARLPGPAFSKHGRAFSAAARARTLSAMGCSTVAGASSACGSHRTSFQLCHNRSISTAALLGARRHSCPARER